jgi:hypothetical protein
MPHLKRTPMPDILRVIGDRNLLGPWFKGSSWSTWRTVLKAAYGMPMTDKERMQFYGVAERDPPAKQVRELWIVAGRRAGKDSIASAIAVHAAIASDTYAPLLRPGERASVLCLACDRDQAQIVLRYIRGYFSKAPLLRELVVREHANGLDLANNVEIIVATNNYRAVRGRTVLCAILDTTGSLINAVPQYYPASMGKFRPSSDCQTIDYRIVRHARHHVNCADYGGAQSLIAVPNYIQTISKA